MKMYIALFFVTLAVLQCSSAPASDSAESKEADKDQSSEEKKSVCEPGKSLKKDCNTCFCAKDGSGYACTRKACPPRPNEELIVDANIEEAITEATSEVTTEIPTEDVSEVNKEINIQNIPKIQWGPLYVPGTPCPGKTFYSECNQCFCSKDGKSAGCTLMLCDGLRKIHELQTKDAVEVA